MNNQISDILNSAEFAEEQLVASVQSLLEEVLLEKGWTKSDLAKAMGVTKARVSQIFSQNQNFTLRLLAKAFHALGAPISIGRTATLETKSMPHCRDEQRIEHILDEIPWLTEDNFTRSIHVSHQSALSALVAQEVERTIKASRHKKIASEPEEKWDGWRDARGTVVPFRKVAINA